MLNRRQFFVLQRTCVIFLLDINRDAELFELSKTKNDQ